MQSFWTELKPPNDVLPFEEIEGLLHHLKLGHTEIVPWGVLCQLYTSVFGIIENKEALMPPTLFKKRI